jgi:hypothetical protein
MTVTLLILLEAAVAGIILAIGMDSTLKDATYLWRRPGLLLRSVLAMYVLVPLAALALVKVLTLAPWVEIGLLVLAVSAGATLLPRKLMKIDDGAYIFSLVLTSSLLAILFVPAWLAVLVRRLFPAIAERVGSANRDRTDAPGRRHARRRRSRQPDRSWGAAAAAAGPGLARDAERRDGRGHRTQPSAASVCPRRFGATSLGHPRFCACLAMTTRADYQVLQAARTGATAGRQQDSLLPVQRLRPRWRNEL